MKGLWKELISGWNHKDSKRKKQTRNNTLKDNGCYIIRTYDGHKNSNKKVNPEVFRNETETSKTFAGGYVETKPIVTEVKIYKALVTWRKVDENNNFIKSCITCSGFEESWKETLIYTDENSRRSIYFDTNNVYSAITNESIGDFLSINKKQTWSLKISNKKCTDRTIVLPKDLIKKAIERKNKITVEDFQKDGSFIYGKPLSSWKMMTFFNDGKRRKFAQNRANRMDRRNIKTWLNKHDISLEVKTHTLSKSIAWEL